MLACNNYYHQHYQINFLCLLFRSNLNHHGHDIYIFLFYQVFLLIQQDHHKFFLFPYLKGFNFFLFRKVFF